MEPLISIIIPVWKVDRFLEKCLDSVINQTYRNLQIILVDDGSTDQSGKICDNLALKDERIRVFHIQNGEQLHAREYAIKRANGLRFSARIVRFLNKKSSVFMVCAGILRSFSRRLNHYYAFRKNFKAYRMIYSLATRRLCFPDTSCCPGKIVATTINEHWVASFMNYVMKSTNWIGLSRYSN